MTRRIKKVLVANRGEIALRIVRACRDAGYTSVAIASDSDREAKYVRAADETQFLPGNSPLETYLNQQAILDLAKAADADAVHPGYGLLSENEEFAAAVEASGLIWIGPDAQAIAALGDKIRARAIAQEVGAPLLPASVDGDLTLEKAQEFVAAHGLPVIIKAKSGGGGRGMRIVHDSTELASSLESAQREAGLAFGRAECFIERYAEHARHVETQCLADAHGNVVVLSTRDCTLQRRQQKLVEEAPAPFLDATQETQLVEASVKILEAVGYRGAATCEFLINDRGELNFLEVNTRLQVEHPVTEEVTSVDIIRAMFRIAEGAALPTEAPRVAGHAIEFRINAEDPWADFQPSAGLITGLSLPGGPGVRLDVGYDTGDTVPPFYDSLLGKIVVWGETRDEALARARRALAEFAIVGPKTVAPLHRAILKRPEFTASDGAGFVVHTRWIDEQIGTLSDAARDLVTSAPVLSVAGSDTDVAEEEDEGPEYRVGIKAPMSGLVLKWLIEEGDMISPGDEIALMEAMKMEQTIVAETPGVVVCLNVAAGGFIDADEDLAGLD